MTEIDTEAFDEATKTAREFGDAARRLEEKRKPWGFIPRGFGPTRPRDR